MTAPPWTPPTAARRRAILRRARTIAIVGASANPARAANFVLAYLRSSSADYTLWPVTPREDQILGLRTYPSLDALPGTPDIVDVFRRVDQLPGVAREAVAAGAGALWLQLGLHSDEAVRPSDHLSCLGLVIPPKGGLLPGCVTNGVLVRIT